jgi:hypothetical protein
VQVAAGPVVPLDDQHLASEARQRRARDQATHAAADHHDVVGVVPGLAVEAHGGNLAITR